MEAVTRDQLLTCHALSLPQANQSLTLNVMWPKWLWCNLYDVAGHHSDWSSHKQRLEGVTNYSHAIMVTFPWDQLYHHMTSVGTATDQAKSSNSPACNLWSLHSAHPDADSTCWNSLAVCTPTVTWWRSIVSCNCYLESLPKQWWWSCTTQQ